MKEAGRAHPQLARVGAKPPGQIGIQSETSLFNPPTVSLYVQQPERCGGLFHISQHLSKEDFMLLAAHTQSRLRH